MQLFDDISLFDEGTKRFTDFALPGDDLRLWEQFFPKRVSDHYFQKLLLETPWQQRLRKMYDKMLPDPRLTACYGGKSGLEWTTELLDIKRLVEAACQISFDHVLLNYYRDGNDSVAWHSDTMSADGKHHPIASVTFGATRIFKIRCKIHGDLSSGAQWNIPLTHGSFLLMGDHMQKYYEHHVPKTSRKVGPRINLTFRIAEPGKAIYLVHPVVK
ncbi:MAG: alpha-ketoglutarate-dependent dioxygenase AlkB [Agriterribacter sp.]